MTVGIGAICEEGKVLIVAADRLVTAGGVEFEGDVRKITPLGPRLVAASTGTQSDTWHIFKRAKVPKGSVESVPRLAKKLLKAREQFRRQQVESLFTKRNLGLTLRQFGKQSATIITPVYQDVYQRILNYGGNLFLIAGFDADGAHLLTIGETGALPVSHTDPSFTTIGCGNAESHSAMIRFGYSRVASLPEALVQVFEAKRAAEYVSGVGRTTDIAIIRETGVKMLDAEQVDRVRAICEAVMRPPPLSADQRSVLDAICLPCPPQLGQ